MGDCEYLRNKLINPIKMEANTIYWMTDRCPHEALPQEEAGPRQWFRFVTSKVGVWYEDHSTVNELGVTPSPNCRIVKGNKFLK